MLTPEDVDRIEAAARAQTRLEFSTGVVLTPREVLALVAAHRAQFPSPPPAAAT